MMFTQDPFNPVGFGDEALQGRQVRLDREFYSLALLELIYNKYLEWKWNWNPFFPAKRGGKNIYQSWDFKCFLLLWIGLVALSKESHYKSGKIFAKGLDFIWKWFLVLQVLGIFFELREE